ncbi:TRAP transporter permease [Gelria sp. Kuro-4]|uniref:TRAP transporter permease n=1 Tax=Gelria sp. Kuro-4 TaxID=2796927 RepID=UPI001BF0E64E|nr:TRAP transporter permease [Gelria sp. Kuro-4]BCV24124.1 C4-dicarboxylate ABC transporter [Gelria sp. Kuro-4]
MSETGAGSAGGLKQTAALQIDVEQLGPRTRSFRGVPAVIISLIAIAASLFHLYTAQFGLFFALTQRDIHWMFMSVLIFLLYPATKDAARNRLPWYDVIMIVLALTGGLYILIDMENIVARAGAPTRADVILGLIMVLLVLEAARRTIGWALPVVAVAALAYAYFGRYMPGLLAHKGYSLQRIFPYQFLTTEGIYGVPLGVSATFVYLFILFGSFLEKTGAGKFFIDLAFALTGSSQGGPAKAAVVSSGLMGSVSGSSVANVVTTGSFTIPLMKKVGYEPYFAGAVEAASSTGGQIMPPVMGAAAFIMAEVLGVAYIKVAAAAAIPAILYYISLFAQVHFRAGRLGLRGLTRDQLPGLKETISRGWHLLVPLAALIVVLVRGYSPMKAVFWTIVLTVGLSFLKRETRMTPRRFVAALEDGARSAVEVAAACACAGIVVGVVTMTGLGLKLAGLIVTWSQGLLALALPLTMLASILLGMALPTTAKYVVLSTLAAPALVRLGVPPMAAHMFILYFGVVADITPPVALAAYAGAGVAGANAMKTGWAAVQIGLAAFIVPFMFAYSPSLVLIGSAGEIILASLTATVGVISLAAGIQGWILTRTRLWERVVCLGAALLLIRPGLVTDLVGLVGLSAVLVRQFAATRSAAGREVRAREDAVTSE